MKRFFRRIGRRGAFLLFLATLDFLFGFALLHPHILAFKSYLPTDDWAAIWLGVGAVCLFQAFSKKDKFAFTLAVGLKIAWAILQFRWWMVYHLPLGWISVIIWATFAATVGIVASWPEVPEIIVPEPPTFEIEIPVPEDSV